MEPSFGAVIAHGSGVVWSECRDMLPPGAHMLVAVERGVDALAIRAVGFEVRDTIIVVAGSQSKPFILYRKPLATTLIHNTASYGAGGININGCRIAGGPGYEEEVRRNIEAFGRLQAKNPGWKNSSEYAPNVEGALKGRWPPNVAFVHGGSCQDQCAPGCPISALEAEAGTSGRFFPQFRGDSDPLIHWLTRLVCPGDATSPLGG